MPRRQNLERDAPRLAGEFEVGHELAAAVDLDGGDGERHGLDHDREEAPGVAGRGGAQVMVSLAGQRIVVASGLVDFRKGHDPLAAVVRNDLGLEPYSGVAYVFGAKRPDRIKGAGLVLAYKRLEQGHFARPAVHNGVMRLTRAQFEALYEGLDWCRAWSPRMRRPRASGLTQIAPGREAGLHRQPFGTG